MTQGPLRWEPAADIESKHPVLRDKSAAFGAVLGGFLYGDWMVTVVRIHLFSNQQRNNNLETNRTLHSVWWQLGYNRKLCVLWTMKTALLANHGKETNQQFSGCQPDNLCFWRVTFVDATSTLTFISYHRISKSSQSRASLPVKKNWSFFFAFSNAKCFLQAMGKTLFWSCGLLSALPLKTTF